MSKRENLIYFFGVASGMISLGVGLVVYFWQSGYVPG
jgi:hypothetical protein